MTNSSEQTIRAAREEFNKAIAAKDPRAIRNLLAPNYHIVTGRSAQFHGADEEQTRWEETFRTDPTTLYKRTPGEIIINEEWGIAQETGQWQGSYTLQNTIIQASGVYFAKWQRARNGTWLVQAEVFTTLKCNGPCEPPDPI